METSHVQRVVDDLLGLFPKKLDLSLDRIIRLLKRLGNPHLKLTPTIIHIAGTNGKGSASAICRALLESAGYCVHVYSSPHLVNWNERCRLGQIGGGQLITDNQLLEVIRHTIKVNRQEPISVFEIFTAAAFTLFSTHPADAIILEVGLGGRFDATNVIKNPAVSLIMPIDYDHETFLGNTIAQISFEKGGIIKPKIPVIIGKQDHDVTLSVLSSLADKNKAPYSIFDQDYQSYEEHGRMVFQNNHGLMDLPLPNLIGAHQIANAGAAIEAVYQAGFQLSEQAINQALRNLYWPARMQHLTRGQLVNQLPPHTDLWLDGGHNPAAGKAVAAEFTRWKKKTKRPIVMIASMLKTKDNVGYFRPFKNLVDEVYTIPLTSSDAGLCPKILAELAQKAGLMASPQADLQEALLKISLKHKEAIIFIGGSLYLAGNILRDNETPPC
ncbi:bifunctional folylpolyglutamate synthase/dihydrofolate synthase [Bartonella bacilliformis]|uniref:tetrahydrofolate synthase n=2 Tax=Bartonella bacilliformis TaxID=774 RepID=A1UUE6_BARBK|nr:folylpolyglutamate synthase/dihydrofolate synthase family protein [Bartonella bacilliformis]ABM44867.1 folylpolyglutamate synthase [Bartonella bacilliformis KC583]AMG85218.1 bifunctional folylpolyglutamate synthase/dihydrofolate synthase [Bartonella bacilliformis]EKS42913.1 folylpolyglutamate synthase [Bartonella bacilliformis INS]KZN22295.1 bifunctional folylpolyglutamate synthase/dihydrofolate synthase [Bartonella bacilliformis]QFZ90878.1 bifunctional folylpolyglutamate synthase/dihydrofo